MLVFITICTIRNDKTVRIIKETKRKIEIYLKLFFPFSNQKTQSSVTIATALEPNFKFDCYRLHCCFFTLRILISINKQL